MVYGSAETNTAAATAAAEGREDNGFKAPFFEHDKYVHVVWVKTSLEQGLAYKFYRGTNSLFGTMIDQGPELVAEILNVPEKTVMNQLYNIGKNDNYYGGTIDDVRFWNR